MLCPHVVEGSVHGSLNMLWVCGRQEIVVEVTWTSLATQFILPRKMRASQGEWLGRR